MLDKLKIGILDLLTILVPGAFLLFIISDKLMDFATHTWKGYPLLSSQWITLGVSFALAYILGHFIFFLGSFLDALIYEKVRRVYWHEHAKLTAYAVMLKEKKTGPLARKTLSAWKWACATLMSTQPAIYAEVERQMAESKFFRSLIIVLIVAIFTFPAAERTQGMILLFVVIIILSMIRYLTQRQRSLQTAYHGILSTSNIILPPQPDPAIYAGVKNDLVYPSEKLHRRIQENDEKGKLFRPDKFFYGILKFLYSVGWCLIPFFSMLVNSIRSLKKSEVKNFGAEQKERLIKMNEKRNRVMHSQIKMEE